eukprot:CAMPEP_0204180900 /NCGR_PEP_ID=MMETSP0361-20130328/51416_1 /ASSEMBLY_ACC=CAM_ASM_000343 /TAXON_ID=268821 /ORGANISM="Scrippsiella Hangoei, Strain SHTV-5" /LENGTH=234 /DNA_ID=CAMNT_0051140391 /DNA_START=42 /DNA_END=743 /DNA_ORIENTATION=+
MPWVEGLALGAAKPEHACVNSSAALARLGSTNGSSVCCFCDRHANGLRALLPEQVRTWQAQHCGAELNEGQTDKAATGHHHGELKVLLVIHGYPPLYNAGSEVYTQTLARALQQRGHSVVVFCREEDTIAPYFRVRKDHDGPVPLHIINIPNLRDRYRVEEVDRALGELMDEFKPDVVHSGHLNHLSTSLVQEVTRRGIPFIYTLHDFWLLCPRGQFLQFVGDGPSDLWPVCDG